MDVVWSPIDREALLHALVSGGGALLIAYACYGRATHRVSPAQARGLATAGLGFLVSAGASIYLRDRATLGAAVSLAGCVVALAGMRAVVRERMERQSAARHGAPRRRD